ncbi:arylsulfatase [Maribellus luteus]|uniref:Arylsulfatase n=1 Tax=Maribellus luteus TaxID=2305463 RepID=A0A399T027_9BACT|nr:arylsulfatase [Maribellus luteus]RIJ47975.1 arylsulfatase [Maribellus luteus]
MTNFLTKTWLTFFVVAAILQAVSAQQATHPNVVLIITDDQGYGDLGCTGNPHVKTPVLDRFAEENIRFTNFYVSPVCAPTRSSLMTGRYSLRTGVRDTYNGGSIMAASETTIAEMLKEEGYNTGIFGKWHLGDCYPSRPMDQGFDESLVHLSGGMGQVGDITTWFKGDSSYFDPVLWHNGKPEPYTGYCSDIFADEAIRFIESNKEKPFFCYLSFNAPHTPLQVPAKYYEMYRDIDPSSGFENDSRPFPEMSEKDKEDARKVYGMVTNIDDNIGKLLQRLDELQLSENTLVIFMTDNGPQQPRYVAGMRGRKGSVYRGGVRVPFFMRYPGMGSKEVNATTAHIDVLPTIAEICGAKLPEQRVIDGKSLFSLLTKDNYDRQERSLFFYWTRRYPELYNNMALYKGDYKLVGFTSFDAGIGDFELYNIKDDPYEQENILPKNKDIAKKLKTELDLTYRDLISSENILHQPLIEIGNKNENPIILNRNEADGERGIWAQEDVFGKWNVRVNPGKYNVTFKFVQAIEGGGTLLLETNGVVNRMDNSENTDVLEMKNVDLPGYEGELMANYFSSGKKILPFWIELEKVD